MTKSWFAELKARLSECLRRARGENMLTVCKPLGRYRRIQDVPLPPPLDLDIDIVELLLEERQVENH